MYTFLVWAQKEPTPDFESRLATSKQIVQSVFPDFKTPYQTQLTLLPEVNGGFFSLYPRSNTPGLLDFFVDDTCYVIALGEMFGQKKQALAKTVADAWHAGGSDAARCLDGCFSAVMIDRKTGELHVISDMLGRRSLRTFCDGNHFLVSPHDLVLLATGRVPDKLNLQAAASIVRFGWSINGAPLVQDLCACDPNSVTTWKQGKTTDRFNPLMLGSERIDPSDSKNIRNNIDAMIETTRHNLVTRCAAARGVCADLTAGIDSRAVLALLLSLDLKIPVRTQTTGQPHSLDVRTATRLARFYRIEHAHSIPDPPLGENFLAHSKMLAFMMNGDTESKRALGAPPQFQNSLEVKLSGVAGETLRGRYYPTLRDFRSTDSLTWHSVSAYVQKIIKPPAGLSWKNKEHLKRISSLVEANIYKYTQMSANAYDWLDLFYLFDIHARRDSMVPRALWTTERFAPFDSPRLLQLAFNLPAPISQHALLHKTIIKRFLPRSTWTPINDDTILSVMHDSIYTKTIQKTLAKLAGATWGQSTTKTLSPGISQH